MTVELLYYKNVMALSEFSLVQSDGPYKHVVLNGVCRKL